MDRPTMAQMLLGQQHGGTSLEDGEGPGGIAGYLDRRAQRAVKDMLWDATMGMGAIGASSVLAPATGGLSYPIGYGIGGMNLGRAAEHGGDFILKAISSNRFKKMPEGPPGSN